MVSEVFATGGGSMMELGLIPLMVSSGDYEYFMEHGGAGMDALQVYLHLLFVSSLQMAREAV